MITNIRKKDLNEQNGSGFFLPDLCHARSVFVVVLVSELLALSISLVRFEPDVFWLHLGRYSIVIQWIALLSTALLCMFRPVLRRLTDLLAGFVSYCLVLLVTLMVIICAIWIESIILGQDSIHLLEHSGFFSSLLVSSILAAIVLRLFYLQAQYRKRVEITADAKLQALQARIQPHFLFNSMNIIAGLIPHDPELAEKMIEDLSDLFRASLAEHRSQVSLQSEIDLCKRYLGIEQLRLGERLQCQWQLSQGIDAVSIPPLTLQPLIENAIYHGIQPLIEGGMVCISVIMQKDHCKIAIENPFSAKATTNNDGNSIAINNISDRLQMLYGDQASLDMQISHSKCTVTVIIPCREMDE